MKKFVVPTALVLSAALAVCSFAISAKVSTAEDASALEKLSSMNIAEGFEDGELHPEALLTRAQFAKLLCSTFPDTAFNAAAGSFVDMPESHWSYDYVQKAVSAGWLQGYPDNTFRPDDNITYEQAVTVVCRLLGLTGYGYDYPRAYVAAAIDNSISDGINSFIGEEINREQAARLIVNSLAYEDGQVSYNIDNSINVSSTTAGLKNITSGSSGGGGGGSRGDAGLSAVMYESAFADTTAADGIYEPYMPVNAEEYSLNEENVFKDPVTSPLSTFSIDTDTASYSNLRRFILNGQNIPTGSVRSEELINYFDYTAAEIEEGKPFGIRYVVSDCPWNPENDLAMITVSGEELKERQPSNLVFLIDTSGSMYSRNKLALVKQALAMLLEKLDDNDRISIVTYASGTGVALEPTPATEKEKILEVINSLRAGGSTAGASGINLAYEQAEKFKVEGNNRIILCTDGDFNVGISSEGDLEKLISEKRDSGIFLSVLGFGMGNYKDSKMEILADKGNGNYAYIDNLREAKKVLVDEMPGTIYTIAKDVKIQTEFNPEKVGSYRLIGYENRLLNNEDFENDNKDAGELGAGATVTVLYEIVPRAGEAVSDLKYQTTQGIGSDELMTVKIRYKEPGGSESILSEYPVAYEKSANPGDDFNFAAAVAELGMILNDSEHKGNSTYDTVTELARSGLGDDRFGLRHEFVQLVDLLMFEQKYSD